MLITMYLVRYVLGPVRIYQGVPGLVSVVIGRGNVGDHDGAAVPGQGFFQEPGQLGVPEGHVLALLLRQRVDDVAQRQERPVDVGAFGEALAPVLKRFPIICICLAVYRNICPYMTIAETVIKAHLPVSERPFRNRPGRSCKADPI